MQGFCYFGKPAQQPLLEDAQSRKNRKELAKVAVQSKKKMVNLPVRVGRGALVRGFGVLNENRRTFQAHPKPYRMYRARQCIRNLGHWRTSRKQCWKNAAKGVKFGDITVKHLENHVHFMCPLCKQTGLSHTLVRAVLAAEQCESERSPTSETGR